MRPWAQAASKDGAAGPWDSDACVSAKQNSGKHVSFLAPFCVSKSKNLIFHVSFSFRLLRKPPFLVGRIQDFIQGRVSACAGRGVAWAATETAPPVLVDCPRREALEISRCRQRACGIRQRCRTCLACIQSTSGDIGLSLPLPNSAGTEEWIETNRAQSHEKDPLRTAY